jgi:hypothetical protein
VSPSPPARIPTIAVVGIGQVWMLAQAQLRQAERRSASSRSVEQPGPPISSTSSIAMA